MTSFARCAPIRHRKTYRSCYSLHAPAGRRWPPGCRPAANDYIVKPFDPVELLARARVHYDLTSRRRQAQDQAKNLQTALSHSRELSYAIGILMAQRKLTADESFELLRRYARSTNRKLRVVAEQIVLTGTLPTPEPPRRA